MVNDKINVVGTNIAEKAIMIWNVADMLRDPFKPHEYGLVILPMIHFNPRSPCGERRILRRRSLQPCIISIHAPRVGSDVLWFFAASINFYFNPRSPCGERQLMECRSQIIS